MRITTITPRMVALEVVGAQRQPNLTKVNQLVPLRNGNQGRDFQCHLQEL